MRFAAAAGACTALAAAVGVSHSQLGPQPAIPPSLHLHGQTPGSPPALPALPCPPHLQGSHSGTVLYTLSGVLTTLYLRMRALLPSAAISPGNSRSSSCRGPSLRRASSRR